MPLPTLAARPAAQNHVTVANADDGDETTYAQRVETLERMGDQIQNKASGPCERGLKEGPEKGLAGSPWEALHNCAANLCCALRSTTAMHTALRAGPESGA